MKIINDDLYTDTLKRGKIEFFPNPYKTTYNEVNWGQIGMDLLEKERKNTLTQDEKEKKFPLMPEHHIKEDFYIVELDNADSGYLYLVKATSLKEAIEKVWIQYVEPLNKEINEYSSPYYKHELHAIKVSNYFDEETDVVCLQ